MRTKSILGLLFVMLATPVLAQEPPQPQIQQQLDAATSQITKLTVALANAVADYAKRADEADKRTMAAEQQAAAARKDLADYKAANPAQPKSEAPK